MDKSIGDMKTMDGTPEHGGYTLFEGDTLGQYRIIRALGRGGMGEVYLCERAILTTKHAVKLLPAERSDSPGFVQRFHDEARVMARLQHPGIVKIVHADDKSGRHYLVMDFVGADGTDEPFDLEDALAAAPGNRLPPEIVARLGRKIAEAVGAAHEAGVVHRDLKPANVLLTSRDLAKADARVADFGLARLLGEDWVLSRVDTSMRQSMSMGGMSTRVRPRAERDTAGAILGTYEYMSPEQREGMDACERSDIFALGVMLYRMVTGKRLMGMAKPVSKVVPGLDPAWDDLTGRCLEEDPGDRPGDMGEVAGLLAGLSRREDAAVKSAPPPVASRPEPMPVPRKSPPVTSEPSIPQSVTSPPRKRAARPAKKKRGARLFWGLLVLVAMVAGGVWIMRDEPARRIPPVVPPRADPPTTRPVVTTPAVQEPAPEPRPPPTARGGPVAGENWTSPTTVMEFVEVKAGSFEMGSFDGRDNEKPVRTVRITRDFWMGKHEVTQREYEQLTGNNPSHFKGDNLPVEMVSLVDAVRFCEELTRREREAGRLPQGYVYRLPTEAEWEYAARGGHRARATTYAGSDDINAVAWYTSNSGGKTHPVGTKAANELGLHDMSGNVWEWVHDWHLDSYDGLSTTDPKGPTSASGSGRVFRGGSWGNPATFCRVAIRFRCWPFDSDYLLGFRVVLGPSL